MSESARIRPPMTVDAKRYIVGGLPGSDWAANARTADEATMRKGRHIERVHLVEMPVEEARTLLREFPIKVPTGVGFMTNAGLVSGPNPDDSRSSPDDARFSGSIR